MNEYEIRRRASRPEYLERGIAWVRYAIGATIIVALVGLVWGGRVLYYNVTHVKTVYAAVSADTIEISPTGDARISKMMVNSGQNVTIGQVLALLDPMSLSEGVSEAYAELAGKQAILSKAQVELEIARQQGSAEQRKAQASFEAAQAAVLQSQSELQKRQSVDLPRQSQAEAELAQAQAQLRNLEQGTPPEVIAEARAEVQAKDVMLKQKSSAHERSASLLKKGLIPAQEEEQARADEQVARANRDVVSERLKRLEAGHTSDEIEAARQTVVARKAEVAQIKAEGQQQQKNLEREIAIRSARTREAEAELSSKSSSIKGVRLKAADIRATSADVAKSRATVKASQQALTNMQLLSPVDGIVLQIERHPGEVITKTTPVLILLNKENGYWVTAYFNELQVARIGVGQHAEIRLPAHRDKFLPGTVVAVGRMAEGKSPRGGGSSDNLESSLPTKGYVPVKIAFDPGKIRVMTGMTAFVTIETGWGKGRY